jgi:formylglycine-generating enzyme required for sulfatase activity
VEPTGANANVGGISFNIAGANGAKYSVKSNMGDKPVNYVSWYDADRFTNWLNNGQGNADTETGANTLNGNNGLITKNSGPGVTVWLSSEDEWYKAAYYDPTLNSGAGGYWTYATQSNSAPTVATADSSGNASNPGANVANYNSGADWNSLNGNVTTVGSAAANNYFGTADMNGNVWEWNVAVIGSSRGLRGGSWPSGSLAASFRNSNVPCSANGSPGRRRMCWTCWWKPSSPAP